MTDPMKPADPLHGRTCHARNKGGKSKCNNYAMRGQNVCRMHGGKSPQALEKAEHRLRALEFPAIETLEYLIRHADMDSVKFQAARWLLELLGHKTALEVKQDGKVTIEVEYIGRTAALDGKPPRVLDVPHTNGVSWPGHNGSNGVHN